MIRFVGDPLHPSDFSQSWFGAKALLNGGNPYALVGPGKVYDWEWPLFYPATSMVAAIPLSFLPQLQAAMVFVWISTFALAYAATVSGWFRLFMFFTPAFAFAGGAAQWSPLLTASLIVPPVGLFLAAKPNIGAAFFISGSARMRWLALAGGTVLIGLSFAFLPDWPAYWVDALRHHEQLGVPLARRGGVLILIALLKWRRPETILLVALAAVPQTTYWYEALPLFLIPAGFIEMFSLVAALSAGAILEHLFIATQDHVLYNQQVGALVVAFAYLPAMILILRRPNVRAQAPWTGTRVYGSVPSNVGTVVRLEVATSVQSH